MGPKNKTQNTRVFDDFLILCVPEDEYTRRRVYSQGKSVTDFPEDEMSRTKKLSQTSQKTEMLHSDIVAVFLK